MVHMRSEIEPLKDEELEPAPAVLRAERSAAEKHTIITRWSCRCCCAGRTRRRARRLRHGGLGEGLAGQEVMGAQMSARGAGCIVRPVGTGGAADRE